MVGVIDIFPNMTSSMGDGEEGWKGYTREFPIVNVGFRYFPEYDVINRGKGCTRGFPMVAEGSKKKGGVSKET